MSHSLGRRLARLSAAALVLWAGLGSARAVETELRPAAGAWTAAYQAHSPRTDFIDSAFLTLLGLPDRRPDVLGAFLRVMDRTGLPLEDWTAVSPSRQAAAARLGATVYGAELLTEVRSDPDHIAGLEDQKARLRDLQMVAVLLPAPTRLAVMEAFRQVTDRLETRRWRRALAQVRGGTAAWDGGWDRLQEAVDATVEIDEARTGLDRHLAGQAAVLEAVRKSPRMGLAEGLLARPLLARRIEQMHKLRQTLAAAPNAVDFALSEMSGGAPLKEGDRELLEGLKAYVPGLDPDRAVMRRRPFEDYYSAGGQSAGWANHWRDSASSPRARGFISLASTPDKFKLISVAIHEGFHQGDEPYDRMEAALGLLLGRPEDGRRLGNILLEGFTEWRMRQAMLRLLRDGAAGASPFSASIYRLALRRFKAAELAGLESKLRAHWDQDAYEGYVAIVEALIAETGGTGPVEDLVARGNVAPLAKMLGLDRIRMLGELAAVHRRLTAGDSIPVSLSVRIAQEAGLEDWVEMRMKEVVAGIWGAFGRIVALEARMNFFVAEVEAALGRVPPGRKLAALEAMMEDLHPGIYLDSAASHAEAMGDLRADLAKALAKKPSRRERLRSLLTRSRGLYAVGVLSVTFLGWLLWPSMEPLGRAALLAAAAVFFYFAPQLPRAWRVHRRLSDHIRRLMAYLPPSDR